MTADRALGPFDLTGEVPMVTGGNGGKWRAALPTRMIAGRDEANNVKAVAAA